MKFEVQQATKSVQLGTLQVTITALPLGKLAELSPVIFSDTKVETGKTFQAMAEKAPVIVEALKPSYPDVTREEVLKLDLDSFNALFSAVLELSGLRSKASNVPPSETPAGEAAPVVN